MNVENEVAALQQMSTDELRERYADVLGEEPRSRQKAYLIRKIAWRLVSETRIGASALLLRSVDRHWFVPAD